MKPGSPDPSLRGLLLALSLAAILNYAIAEGAGPVGVLWCALAAAAWVLSRRVTLPRWMIAAAVLAAFARSAYLLRAGPVGVSLFSEFLLSVLVVKLAELHRPRDVVQVLMLVVFLHVGAVLTAGTLGVGLLVAVSLPLVVLAAMRLQIYRGLWEERREGGGESRPPPMGWRFPALAGVMSLWGLLVAVVVFLVFPRGLVPTLGAGWSAAATRTIGFADTVRLGQAGLISDSQTPVLTARFEDAKGTNLGEVGRVFYMRGEVLTDYQNGVWTKDDRAAPLSSSARRRAGMGPLAAAEGESIVQRVAVLRARRGDPLFAAYRPDPSTLKIDEPKRPLLSWNPETFILHGYDNGRWAYSVRSFPAPSGPALPGAGAEFPSAVVRAEAGRATGGEETSSEAKARRIVEHLRSGFAYTLDLEAPPRGVDPIEWFLTRSRSGNCEYFASAMAAMCRSLGIEARVVTGYVAVEFDEIAGQYTVRRSNAHAWVEARTERGWTTFDPTPSTEFERIHQAHPTLARRMARWFDDAQDVWARSVVAYDEESRGRLLGSWAVGQGSWSRWLARSARGEQDPAAQESAETPGSWASRLWLPAAALCGAFALLAAGLRLKRWRGMWAARPRETHERLYRDLARSWARSGHPKPAWKPALTHAAEVAARFPALGPAMERFLELYYAARFSGRAWSQEQQLQARRDVESVRAALAGGARKT